jgi:hypothetical protein
VSTLQRAYRTWRANRFAAADAALGLTDWASSCSVLASQSALARLTSSEPPFAGLPSAVADLLKHDTPCRDEHGLTILGRILQVALSVSQESDAVNIFLPPGVETVLACPSLQKHLRQQICQYLLSISALSALLNPDAERPGSPLASPPRLAANSDVKLLFSFRTGVFASYLWRYCGGALAVAAHAIARLADNDLAGMAAVLEALPPCAATFVGPPMLQVLASQPPMRAAAAFARIVQLGLGPEHWTRDPATCIGTDVVACLAAWQCKDLLFLLSEHVRSSVSRNELARQLCEASVAGEPVCDSSCPCADTANPLHPIVFRTGAGQPSGLGVPDMQRGICSLLAGAASAESSGDRAPALASFSDSPTEDPQKQHASPPLQATLVALANAGMLGGSPAYAAMALLLARHSTTAVARRTLLAGFRSGSGNGSVIFMTCCLWRQVDCIRRRLPAADLRKALNAVPASVFESLARGSTLLKDEGHDLLPHNIFPLGTYPLPDDAYLDRGTAYVPHPSLTCTPFASHALLVVMREVSAKKAGRRLCAALVRALPGSHTVTRSLNDRDTAVLATVLAHHLPHFLEPISNLEEQNAIVREQITCLGDEECVVAVQPGAIPAHPLLSNNDEAHQAGEKTLSRSELVEQVTGAISQMCGQLVRATSWEGPYLIGMLLEQLPSDVFERAKQVSNGGNRG